MQMNRKPYKFKVNLESIENYFTETKDLFIASRKLYDNLKIIQIFIEQTCELSVQTEKQSLWQQIRPLPLYTDD